MVASVQSWDSDVRNDVAPVIPSHIYDLKLGQIEPTNTRGGKFAIVLHFSVVGPAEYAGSPLRDMATLGSDTDPQAQLPETQKITRGWGTCKRVLECMYGEKNVPPGDVVALLQACLGFTLSGLVTIEKDNDSTSQYFGNEQNRIDRFYPQGEKQVGTMAKETKLLGARGNAGAAAPPTRPGAPPTPTTLAPRPTAPPAAVAGPAAPASPPATAAPVPQQESLPPAPPASPMAPGGALPASPPPRPPGA